MSHSLFGTKSRDNILTIRDLHQHTYDVSYINSDSAMTSSSRGRKLPISSVPLELTIKLQAKDRNPVLRRSEMREPRNERGPGTELYIGHSPPLSLISSLTHHLSYNTAYRKRRTVRASMNCSPQHYRGTIPYSLLNHRLVLPRQEPKPLRATERRPCP
jgi:hypothetical protein